MPTRHYRLASDPEQALAHLTAVAAEQGWHVDHAASGLGLLVLKGHGSDTAWETAIRIQVQAADEGTTTVVAVTEETFQLHGVLAASKSLHDLFVAAGAKP